MLTKRILVVGLGPTGGCLAAHLAHVGCPVVGVDVWKEHRQAIHEKGLTVEGPAPVRAALDGVFATVEDLPPDPIDYAILAVKTPILPEVCTRILRRKGTFQVVAFQNGIGNEDYLAGVFGPERSMRVAINYAGAVVEPGVIRMTFFHKPNYVGCLCGTPGCSHATELADLMTRSGLDTSASDDIRKLTWKKTILNAALSPVCAVLGQTMAEVMGFPPARELVEAILREGIAVARAAGHEYGEGFFDDCVKYLATAGPHKPSMLVDLEHGLSTEIDFINSKIAAAGREFSVPVPINSTMVALVKALESRKPAGAEEHENRAGSAGRPSSQRG